MGMWLFLKKKEMDSLMIGILISVLCYIIKYGDEMRVGIDIGFSTVENNSTSSTAVENHSKLPDCT